MLSDYNGMFAKGYSDVEELEQEFAGAFGESYGYQDPTLLDLLQQAEISSISGPDLSARKDICSSEAMASAMRLDQIIVSCFFAIAEKS